MTEWPSTHQHASLRLQQPRNQSNQGSFARAGWADDCETAARRNPQVDVAQHRRRGVVIREAEISKFDVDRESPS